MRRAWLGSVALASLAAAACGGDPFTTGPGDGTDAGVAEGGADAQVTDSSRERDSRAESSVDASVDASMDSSMDSSADAGDGGQITDAGTVGSITGTVIDDLLVPIAGVQVHIGAQTATTATDGSFTISGVAAPYDAIIVTPGANGHGHGYVFQQLTRVDPTLQLPLEPLRDGKTTTVQGGIAASAGVAFVDVGPRPTHADWTALSVGSPFSLSASWTGSASLAATGYLLEWSIAATTATLPTTYLWFASQPLQIADGQTETWPAVVPGATPNVSTASLVTSITYPAVRVISDVWCFYRPAASAVVAPELFNDKTAKTGNPASTQYRVPDVPASGNTLVVCARAGGGATGPRGSTMTCQAGLSPTAGSVNLALPSVPLLTSAPATGVTTSTAFTWTAPAAAVHMAAFSSTAAGAPTFAVITTASTAHIPDLSAYGLALPQQTSYSVVVTEAVLPSLVGVDDAVGPGGFATMGATILQGRGPIAGGSVLITETATFSTQ